MDLTNIIFIILSLVVLIYLFYIFKTKKRISILIEFLSLLIYLFIFLYSFFYSFFQNLFSLIGINNPSIFFVYLGIFFLFFICLSLYRITESQRIEITKLVREISFINNKLEKKGKK
jgi:hypothetical protein